MVMSWQNLDRQRRRKRMTPSCYPPPRSTLPKSMLRDCKRIKSDFRLNFALDLDGALNLDLDLDFNNNQPRHEALIKTTGGGYD